MASRNEVLLMTREQNLERSVDLALESTPQVARQFGVCPDVRELSQRLENRQAAVALVDADPQPMSVLAAIEPLVRKYPHTRFVVLSRNPNGELLEEAMQIGARKCVSKGSLVADLPPVLRRLLQDVGAVGSPDGSIVTVKTNGTTVVQTSSTVALKDLQPGTDVTVTGSGAGTETVTATSITAKK